MAEAPRKSRTGLYLLGCLGAAVALACTLVAGIAGGYLVWQARQNLRATPPPAPVAAAVPTEQSTTTAMPAPPTPTPLVVSLPSPTPTPHAPLLPLPTPTVQVAPAGGPTPTPGPAVIPGWNTYEDPGYLRLQYPPSWLLVTTWDEPQFGITSCHCYWILMSEPMVQNSPTPDAVRDWFNTRPLEDLAPGSVYMEILRLDSEYALAVELPPPVDTVTIGGQYEAELFALDEQERIIAFRYADQQGRPWVIVVRLPSGIDENNPQVQRMIGILWTIDHR